MGLPSNLSPDILYALDCMGHGDCVALVDRNFPAVSHGEKVLFSYGTGIVPILESVLRVMPLDYAAMTPVTMMKVTPGMNYVPAVWAEYKQALETAGYGVERICEIDRQTFYEYAQHCSLIIQTAETQRFSNIILQKGIVV